MLALEYLWLIIDTQAKNILYGFKTVSKHLISHVLMPVE